MEYYHAAGGYRETRKYWRDLNRERLRAYQKEWRRLNPEKYEAIVRRYYGKQKLVKELAKQPLGGLLQ